MKVAYVTIADPADPYAWSGINHAIARALTAQGIEVIPIGPLKSTRVLLGKARSALTRPLPGHRYLWSIDPALLRTYARDAERLLADISCDLVFSPGSQVISFLETDRPMVFWTDAPFAAMRDYYAWYKGAGQSSRRHGQEVDDRALQRAAFACYSSRWAADAAIRGHGAEPRRVKVLPFGANLPSDVAEEEVPQLAKKRLSAPWRLLFVGVEWHRKGGDLVLATARVLHARGYPVELMVVGCQPPASVRPLPDWVKIEGFISQHTPAGQQRLAALFRSSLFFFMPSQAEAYGIVFCEANSFGVPCLSQATGGITSIIENGVNGQLFPPGASAEAYADYIIATACAPAQYEKLAVTSFQAFRDRLNWGTSVAGLVKVFEAAVEKPSPVVARSLVNGFTRLTGDRLKVAYVFHRDAQDPQVQSGRPLAILDHMEAAHLEVARVFPLKPAFSYRGLARKSMYALGRQHFRPDREPALLHAFAREIAARTAGKKIDVFFCPGSEAVSYLPAEWPITFCADATFANMLDYYPDFTGMPARYIEHGHALERAALSRAKLAVYPSQWAARSAIDYYRADPNKVAVIPFGANRGAGNTAAEVDSWIDQRPFDEIELLFLGTNWARKGGDLAVEAARLLIASGRRVRLHIVGSKPPTKYQALPWLVTHGYVSPRLAAGRSQLDHLLARMHFLIMPTRAEASARSLCEAAAFGVPVISTATGGIPCIIREGYNGFTLPLEAGPGDYAALIATHCADPAAYRALARRSFVEFEQRLNWRAFIRDYLSLIHERVLPSPA
jgi:glycosyltransferase involved in cell wall biosynthesis